MVGVEVRRYQTAAGKVPLSEWLDGLRDGRARARIIARLDRLSVGLLGDWKSVGEVYPSSVSTRVPATACITGKTARR
jgi:hypothetical protein